MIKKIVTCAFIICCAVDAEYLSSGWHGFGIRPKKNEIYFYTLSSLTVQTRTFKGDAIGFDKKNLSLSFAELDWKGYFTFPSRKFSSVFQANDLTTVELNEKGFFLNDRLVCHYEPLYRNNDPLLDIRIFNTECARKYNLISYPEYTGVNIGLLVNETSKKKIYYTLGEKKYYLKNGSSDYAVEKYNHFQNINSDLKNAISKDLKLEAYLDKLKSCVLKKDYKCLSEKFFVHNEISPLGYKYRELYKLLTNNNHVNLKHSPYVQQRLIDCGAKVISEKTFSEKSVFNYMSYVVVNCFQDHLLNCLDINNIYRYHKAETNFIISKSNARVIIDEDVLGCSFKKSPVYVDGIEVKQKNNDSWYLDSINFYSHRVSGKMNVELDPATCKKSHFKKECEFWEKYFSKHPFKFPDFKKKVLPNLSKGEFDALMKN